MKKFVNIVFLSITKSNKTSGTVINSSHFHSAQIPSSLNNRRQKVGNVSWLSISHTAIQTQKLIKIREAKTTPGDYTIKRDSLKQVGGEIFKQFELNTRCFLNGNKTYIYRAKWIDAPKIPFQ